jgi:hypothetical protein
MVRGIKYSAIAGLVIPLLITFVQYVELTIDIKRIPLSLIYGFYLWPTRIMLMGLHDDHLTLGSFLVMLISVSLNVLIYTCVGLLLACALKTFHFVKQTIGSR